MTGDSLQLARAAGLPPMAVPMTVKMPEPITAPMPSAVSETGPSVFFSAVSGASESEISLSIDLVAKICRGRVLNPSLLGMVWSRFYAVSGRGAAKIDVAAAIAEEYSSTQMLGKDRTSP